MEIINIAEIIVGIVLILFGILAIHAKELIHSVIYLSLMSMFAVLSFVFMKAPDVAITEAVIGSGLVTAIFVFTLLSTKGQVNE
ncbi:MAG: DUF4040 domain-containing protein [Clostridiaceae bacterium]|nr:DUF4040 domain-containing protein [Clostridiaceae bacterium]